MDPRLATVIDPSFSHVVVLIVSTRRVELEMKTMPLSRTVKAASTRKGVAAPAFVSRKALLPIASDGALIVRLLISKVPGKLADVVASMIVALPVDGGELVMKMPDCEFVGGTPSDQFAPTSHLPVA